MTASVESVWSREGQNIPMRRSGVAHIDDTESLSEPYTLYMATGVAVGIPEIDSAAITFQVQGEPDGDWFDLLDHAGDEVELTASTGGVAFTVPELSGWFAMKVRSGTSASPTAQTPGRVITIQAWDE